MPFFIVRRTWRGEPRGEPEETRLVGGCSSPSGAEGLAEAEAYAHTLTARDPDAGVWWASDAGEVHEIEVTTRWPPR